MNITSEHIDRLFASFNGMRVMIIGDVMIDAYTEGVVERMSPEAPVPVLDVRKRYNRLGGAANVALNINALGAEPYICSVIGNDMKGKKFLQLLDENGLETSHIALSGCRSTTLKERIISSGKQMMRIDQEDTFDLTDEEQQQLITIISEALKSEKIDCIILQDYNKGVLTKSLIEATIALARKENIPVVVDPKKKNFLAYKNVTLFKPNAKELREGLAAEDNNSIESNTEKIQELLQCEMVMTTLSEKGIIIRAKTDSTEFHHIPAHQRDIVDVSGAGDTVLSVASLCIVAGENPFNIAAISNIAGGLVCEKVGVVPIDKEKLLSEVKRIYITND